MALREKTYNFPVQTSDSTLRKAFETWTSGDVYVKCVRLHYTRTGGEKPPLVLAHGFSDDGLCWAVVAQFLESRFDVVMVDARGHGRSEAPDDGYNTGQLAHDLAGVVSELRLESPIILGHSMGAATALMLAGLYPQLPRAILLEDPPAWWKKEAPSAPSDQWQQNMRNWIAELKTQSRDELIQKQRQAAPSWSKTEVELWADAHMLLSTSVVNGRGMRSDWEVSLMANISCPTLLLTGDTDKGAIVSENDAEELKQLIPQLKVAHIVGAGHSVHREGFESYMSAVNEFLDEVLRG